MIGLLAPSAFLLIALKSVLSDFWKLSLLMVVRPRLRAAIVIAATSIIIVTIGAIEIFGPTRGGAVRFTVLAIAPALSWQALTWWAWWRDDRATRAAALLIAIANAERLDEPPPAGNRWLPWGNYIFDVEVARRRSIYEPPPI
ncbi:hypothetical protein [Sphingomonas solaris]|uniref:Uncharacterized protein n=1 Tax=Alterirhizorhabdus solaris TaxID=2529389 RepID=A0A558QWC9_9SPHN|nr:hypothetical protein [Sphingomonas solaris]TVV71444.1 hypothetical protein FOY91_16750 [Sphingomonas solaris]